MLLLWGTLRAPSGAAGILAGPWRRHGARPAWPATTVDTGSSLHAARAGARMRANVRVVGNGAPCLARCHAIPAGMRRPCGRLRRQKLQFMALSPCRERALGAVRRTARAATVLHCHARRRLEPCHETWVRHGAGKCASMRAAAWNRATKHESTTAPGKTLPYNAP